MVSHDKGSVSIDIDKRSDAPPTSPPPRDDSVIAEKNAPKRTFESYDDDLLHRAVSDAGRWAFGTVAVAVWVLNPERTKLFRPEGGWWIDPVCHDHGQEEDCPYCRLTDPNYKGYVPPTPVAPGVDLPGVLWAESEQSRRSKKKESRVVWRDLHDMAKDPDQARDVRTEAVAKYGLGWAAGVPFDINDQMGIVMFLARDSVDLAKLSSVSNENYLNCAADMIGSTYALRGPRQEVVRARKKERDEAIRRVRSKIIAQVRMGGTLQDVTPSATTQETDAGTKQSTIGIQDAKTRTWTMVSNTKAKLVSVAQKCKGAGNKPPPSFTIRQSIWTFAGAFITLLILTRLSVRLEDRYGSDWSIPLPPFGALVTLQYGLTAAPASQPPNIIFSQAISLSIALGISYLDGWSLWVRQSLATALVIAVMVKLGITHPPSGAAALLYSGGGYGWGNMAAAMLADVIAIVTSTIINNFNEKRQYPTFWGLRYPIDKYKEIIERKKKTR